MFLPSTGIQLFVLYCTVSLSRGRVLYARPNNNNTLPCPHPPCLTLDDYNVDPGVYLNSNTKFILMAGTHSLTGNLTFDRLSNITLEGSPDFSSRVIGNILLSNVVNVTIQMLVFESAQTGQSQLLFLDSLDISLHVVEFHSNHTHSGHSAIVSLNSNFACMGTLFTGYSDESGGAIAVTNSSMTLYGNNTFSRNSAIKAGGAIYAKSSNVTFEGQTLFLKNTAGAHGGAIMGHDSVVSFNGTNFFDGNSVTVSCTLDDHAPIESGGGAIMLLKSQMELDGFVSFASNTAPNGGALLASFSVITSCGNASFEGNAVTSTDEGVETHLHHDQAEAECGCGGSIWIEGTELDFNTATFSYSVAKYGGSICAFSMSVVTLSGNVLVQQSMADMDGGGLLLKNSHLQIPAAGTMEIAGASARIRGSAICLHNSTVDTLGRLTIQNCFPQVHANSDPKQAHDLDGTLFLERTVANFSGQTVFVNNSASDGGAMYAMTCTVRMKNHSVLDRNRASLSGGGFYLENSRLALQGSMILVNNSAESQGGVAYSSVGSVLLLSGWGTFESNSARDGGVFAFQNRASLIFSSPLHLNITRNCAMLNGGVIFYTDIISTVDCVSDLHSDLHPMPLCFLKLASASPSKNISGLDIELNYKKNTAGNAGSVLYGGNLARCKMLISGVADIQVGDQCESVEGRHIKNPLNVTHIRKFFTPLAAMERPPAIGSAPLQICFCDENGISDCKLQKSVRVARGETFTLSAMTYGQAMGAVPSKIRTHVNGSVEIKAMRRAQKTGKSCTDLPYQIFTRMDFATVVLYPDGPCRDTGIARKTVQVELTRCPDGFNLSRTQTRCECEDRLLLLNATCNINERSIEVKGGVWLQPVYQNSSYVGISLHLNCPVDYCVSDPINLTLDNSDVLCDYNRTGILCGSCKANYSLSLGSFHCLKCSNSYLALLIPFALVGIALVLFLLVLDLTIAKGTVNGLILYANIVQANKAVFLPAQKRSVLTVFIAWLNLDLGIESCFSDGLSAYTHAWLQFVFPLYVWLLVILIIMFSHRSRHVTKWLSTNPVAVLATLMLMSYAKVLQTIICVLRRTYIDTPTGLRAVWSYDGNIGYFESTNHIVLGLVAIAALLILFLPYSLLLLFGWHLQHHSDRKLFSWINKLKPFMDTIYGPFRTEMRYWTGLLLGIRCALFLTFALNGLSSQASNSTSINLLAITSVFACLAILAWLSGRIYNKLYADLLEAVHILNITIFAAATYHVKVTNGDQATLAHISISISFVLFILVVLFHAYLRIKHRVFWKRLHIELTLAQNYSRLKEVFCKGERVEMKRMGEDEDIDMPPGDPEPTTSFVTLREPLLEY